VQRSILGMPEILAIVCQLLPESAIILHQGRESLKGQQQIFSRGACNKQNNGTDGIISV
jgi:hypothetical protein